MMGIASLHLSYAFQRVEWGKAKRAHPTAASRSLATVGTRRLTASLCPPYAATLWQISSDPLFKQRWKFHTHLSSPEGRRSSIPEAAAASPRSCGVLDSPPSRGMTPQMWHRSLTPANKTHVRILAARSARALPSIALEIERAQGRPGACRSRGPRAHEMHGAGTTGSAETSRPSLREWVTAYT
jgi:hypothetical protein